MTDTAAPSHIDLRAVSPSLEQIQGLSLADLSGATEAVFQRGWDAAMVVAQDRIDELARLDAEILKRETREAGETGHREAVRSTRTLIARDLKGLDRPGLSLYDDSSPADDSPVSKAKRLRKLLDRLVDGLPKSASKLLVDRLNEADDLAHDVSRAIDKHAQMPR